MPGRYHEDNHPPHGDSYPWGRSSSEYETTSDGIGDEKPTKNAKQDRNNTSLLVACVAVIIVVVMVVWPDNGGDSNQTARSFVSLTTDYHQLPENPATGEALYTGATLRTCNMSTVLPPEHAAWADLTAWDNQHPNVGVTHSDEQVPATTTPPEPPVESVTPHVTQATTATGAPGSVVTIAVTYGDPVDFDRVAADTGEVKDILLPHIVC